MITPIMADIPEVKPVQLTPEETKLRQEMQKDYSHSSGYTGKAAHQLFMSLKNRGVIPKVRLDDFTQPFFGGRGRSHRDVFISNGCLGDAIFEHSHFVPYLRYFIDGPALPLETIEEFRNILIKDAGTSGMVMDQLCMFARKETRKLRLTKSTARREFWRLAHEVGYEHAGIVREAAGGAGRLG